MYDYISNRKIMNSSPAWLLGVALIIQILAY